MDRCIIRKIHNPPYCLHNTRIFVFFVFILCISINLAQKRALQIQLSIYTLFEDREQVYLCTVASVTYCIYRFCLSLQECKHNKLSCLQSTSHFILSRKSFYSIQLSKSFNTYYCKFPQSLNFFDTLHHNLTN